MNTRIKLNRIFLFCIFLTLGVTLYSCDKDQTTEGNIECDDIYTFNSDSHAIQPIIQLTCAITSCHVAGEGIGDFTSYDNITSYIENGQFGNRTFDIKDMPPDYSPGPKILTEDEFDQLKCWIQSGHIK